MSSHTPLNRRGVKTVPLYSALHPDAKNVLDLLAVRTGSRKNVLLEEILHHVPLDDRGVPTWWTRPLPADDEELPLTGT